ncbi:MAG: endonuclease/exonuclease/phosphatase family protein [Gemmobacter sp.]
MRIATWNVEWFNALFDDDGRLLEDDAPSARHGVSRRDQLAAIGIVLAAVDPDAVVIVEAPDEGRRRSTVRALETFAEACNLRQRRAMIGFPSATEQEIALLWDPDRLTPRHDPQVHPGAPRFDNAFELDLDLDGIPEAVHFARPPLELEIVPASGTPFRMIGVHAKSKAPHGARTPDEMLRIGIENRRKQLAQCHWLRRRVEGILREGRPLIVLGDLNDGPGLDEYEHLFGRSGVEIVMGLEGPPELRLTDPNARAALRRPFGIIPTTARFWIAPEGRYFPALLDYVLVSPDIAAGCPRWRIWHPFDDPECWRVLELREALLNASDHFPVTIDLVL